MAHRRPQEGRAPWWTRPPLAEGGPPACVAGSDWSAMKSWRSRGGEHAALEAGAQHGRLRDSRHGLGSLGAGGGVRSRRVDHSRYWARRGSNFSPVPPRGHDVRQPAAAFLDGSAGNVGVPRTRPRRDPRACHDACFAWRCPRGLRRGRGSARSGWRSAFAALAGLGEACSRRRRRSSGCGRGRRGVVCI